MNLARVPQSWGTLSKLRYPPVRQFPVWKMRAILCLPVNVGGGGELTHAKSFPQCPA